MASTERGMTRGSFVRRMLGMAAAGAAAPLAAEACTPEPALSLQAAPQDTIEVPVSYLVAGFPVTGTVVFTAVGEVVKQEWDREVPDLTPRQCARLWENARLLRRSYDP